MTNIAVVVLDTLRYDVFNEHFDWLDGVRFENAYATSHWTIPSHASLFTGHYPREIGTYGEYPSLNYSDTVAKKLNDSGYTTRMLTNNPQLLIYEGWISGFDQSIGPAGLYQIGDNVFDWESLLRNCDRSVLSTNLLGALRSVFGGYDSVRSIRQRYDILRNPRYDGGAEIMNKRIQKTDFSDQEFLFMNIMETHTPYHPPPGHSNPVTVTAADGFAESVADYDMVQSAYDASAKHLASVYKRIYRQLRNQFDYIITLSDHGELLGEHGLWNHEYSIHPELVHVPLVVSGEKLNKRIIKTKVDLLDVHRTILDLAGIDGDSRGELLLDTMDRDETLIDYHGTVPFHASVFDRGDISPDIHDLLTETLSGVVTNEGGYMYQSHEGIVSPDGIDEQKAAEHIDEVQGQVNWIRNMAKNERDVTESTKKRLQDLGYA